MTPSTSRSLLLLGATPSSIAVAAALPGGAPPPDTAATPAKVRRRQLEDTWKSFSMHANEDLIPFHARLDDLLAVVPCMRKPTISPLSDDGFAVKIAVPRTELADLIPLVRQAGGTDILVTQPQLIVPGGAV